MLLITIYAGVGKLLKSHVRPMAGFMLLTGYVLAAAPVPTDSVYQLSGTFTDQNAQPFQLKNRRGHVQLVTMFYSSCPYACPLIVDSALGVERALSPPQRGQLSVLMISLDSKRDTPKVLAALAAKRKLDPSRWTLARAEPLTVRKIAALLGVRYRELENGEFNHSSLLILLDAQGRILARTDKMTPVPDAQFLTQVRKALSRQNAK
jgi:protein SCO1